MKKIISSLHRKKIITNNNKCYYAIKIKQHKNGLLRIRIIHFQGQIVLHLSYQTN